MKIKHRAFTKDGTGSIKLVPESEEDLWHVYNLIRAGDRLFASTTRKVQTGPREEQTERIRLKVEIAVVSVDYDGASECRCKGTCTSENQHIPLGAFHTIVLQPDHDLKLTKDVWDVLDIKRLADASELSSNADLAVVLITEGLAHVCLVGRSSTSLRAKVQIALPKKRGAASASGYDSAYGRFQLRVYEAVAAHVRLDVCKCLLIAGPGFAKDKFREFLLERASATGNKPLSAFKANIATAPASTAYLAGIEEILGNEALAARIADTKATQEIRVLKEFFDVLYVDSARAFYGPGHVVAAAAQGAVAKLLITDSLYRVHDVKARRRWVALVESVQEGGGKVYEFSSRHESGKQLQDFSGIAAVLRFPMPELEEEDPATLLAALEI
eukprot:jgi/Ulvmu1/650/UM010_0021.1